MKKLTTQEEDKIIDLYINQKLSTTKVGEMVGYSSTLVSKVVKRRGYSTRSISKAKKGVKRGRSISLEDVLPLYKSGLSAQKVGDKLSCSQCTVLRILKENDIEIRNFSDYDLADREKHKEMRMLYLEGKSILEVANELNVSYTNTHKVLTKFGVVRKEERFLGNLGNTQILEVKNKVRETWKRKKEAGEYDHIYLERTGYTYKEFQEIQPKFKKYHQQVRTITNRQPLQELDNFDKRGKAGIEGAYHLDHIYSIIDGFKNDVDPNIIGSIVNLQMIPWEENLVKNSNSWLKLDELEKLFESRV
mgnify:CR=1 FL=1